MNNDIWRVGINYTTSRRFEWMHDLFAKDVIQYVEILIDNFLSIDVAGLQRDLDGIPIAFHIMSSRFLEVSPDKLRELAVPLRRLIKAVSPIYVSDHVGVFSFQGRSLPILGEYDYDAIERAIDATCRWQDILGHRLLLENFPSYLKEGADQPAFFSELLARSGAGLLFDVSNAVVADSNVGVQTQRWMPLLSSCTNFHAGGYSTAQEDARVFIDSHDCSLSDATRSLIRLIQSANIARGPKTFTVEFDHSVDEAAWEADLRWVKPEEIAE